MFDAIEIKDKHVFIVCSGYNAKVYREKIKKYIKANEEDMIVIGCKNMSNIVSPHYCVWGDGRGWGLFGQKMSPTTIPVFANSIKKSSIREHWKGRYERYKIRLSCKDKSLSGYDNIKFCFERGNLSGQFKTTGCQVIFLSHYKEAKKISIAGMDGYSFNSLEDLYDKDNKENVVASQHCYSKGLTNFKFRTKNTRNVSRKSFKEVKAIYKKFKENDLMTKKVLLALKSHGIEFKIITPTVFKDFYDSTVLDIKE